MAVRNGSPTRSQHDVPAAKRHRKGKRVTFDVPPAASQDDDQVNGIGAAASRVTSSTIAESCTKPQPGDQLQEELKESLLQQEDADADNIAPPDTLRSTRKRKAPAEAIEAEDGVAGGKQRAVKEPATRKIRRAKAKAGK